MQSSILFRILSEFCYTFTRLYHHHLLQHLTFIHMYIHIIIIITYGHDVDDKGRKSIIYETFFISFYLLFLPPCSHFIKKLSNFFILPVWLALEVCEEVSWEEKWVLKVLLHRTLVCVCVHVSFLVWKDADEKSVEKIKNVILEDDEKVSAMWKVKVILIQIIIIKGIQQS